jgi:hypothetical protein
MERRSLHLLGGANFLEEDFRGASLGMCAVCVRGYEEQVSGRCDAPPPAALHSFL